MKKELHVAAAAICRGDEVFISLRDAHKHQGGLWEFPGGKIEADETPPQALARELYEELGIQVTASEPLIRVPYEYPDINVCLHIFEVTAFEGEPWGKEGQPTRWIKRKELVDYHFPAANQPIVNACLLPKQWMITPEASDCDLSLQQVEQALPKGATGIFVRGKDSETEEYKQSAKALMALAAQNDCLVSLNTSLAVAKELNADALHLNQHRLKALSGREAFAGRWLSVSCHDAESLQMAVDKGVDFVLLSPVLPTQSHPNEENLGWSTFADLANSVPIPVIALGGVAPTDLSTAKDHGACAIAAISAWL